MHIVKAVIQGVGESVMLRFKTADAAELSWSEIEAFRTRIFTEKTEPYIATDDYGHKVALPAYQVLLVMMIDIDKSMEGDVVFNYDKHQVEQRTVSRLQAGSPIIPVGADALNGLRRPQ
jgi:hypothetical protein